MYIATSYLIHFCLFYSLSSKLWSLLYQLWCVYIEESLQMPQVHYRDVHTCCHLFWRTQPKPFTLKIHWITKSLINKWVLIFFPQMAVFALLYLWHCTVWTIAMPICLFSINFPCSCSKSLYSQLYICAATSSQIY